MNIVLYQPEIPWNTGAVGRTSTFALCNSTLPYALAIATKGWDKAAKEDPGLASGLNMKDGQITNAAVAEALA